MYTCQPSTGNSPCLASAWISCIISYFSPPYIPVLHSSWHTFSELTHLPIILLLILCLPGMPSLPLFTYKYSIYFSNVISSTKPYVFPTPNRSEHSLLWISLNFVYTSVTICVIYCLLLELLAHLIDSVLDGKRLEVLDIMFDFMSSSGSNQGFHAE